MTKTFHGAALEILRSGSAEKMEFMSPQRPAVWNVHDVIGQLFGPVLEKVESSMIISLGGAFENSIEMSSSSPFSMEH